MTMTYYGTTAGSTSKNPPTLLYSVVGGQIPFPGDLTTKAMGGKVWFYSSTNAPTDVDDAGAFTDGGVLGMKPGDVLIGVVNGGAATTDCFPYIGILNSTNSSLTTAAYNITSNFTT
jgi:hypothetical protein